MISVRNACLAVAVLALLVALFLFARGLTQYAYLIAVIVPIAAMSAIATQPSKNPKQ